MSNKMEEFISFQRVKIHFLFQVEKSVLPGEFGQPRPTLHICISMGLDKHIFER